MRKKIKLFRLICIAVVFVVTFFYLTLAYAEKQDAQFCLGKARSFRRQWQAQYMELSYFFKETYKLYKKVYLKQGALMTYKDMMEMYYLGKACGEEEAFLEKLKKSSQEQIRVLRQKKKRR